MDAAFASEQYRGAIVADELKLIDKAALHARAVRAARAAASDGPGEADDVPRRAGADADAFLAALADELLIVRHDFHAGRPAAPFDAIEIALVRGRGAALAASGAARCRIACRAVFGAERLLAAAEPGGLRIKRTVG